MQFRKSGIILAAAAVAAVGSLMALFLLHGRDGGQNTPANAPENAAFSDITEQTGTTAAGQTDSPEMTAETEPELFCPTAELDTAHYPFFTEAGLDVQVYINPLCTEGERYVMLQDLESVILSDPVIVNDLPANADSVTFWVSYDPEQLGSLLSHTMLMRFDPDDDSGEQFYPIENTVTDEQQHRLCAEITEPGIYFAFDFDAWARLWGVQTDSPLCYRNPDIGFTAELPAEVMFAQYMLDCGNLDAYAYLPPEERYTDEYGADHIVPLMFDSSASAEGVTGFTLEWIRDCDGADTAAGHRLEGVRALSELGTAGKWEVTEDTASELPGGAHCRIITVKSEGDPAQGISGSVQMDAYYDLRDGEIVRISYAIDPAQEGTLYQPLRSSLDTFRLI